MYGSIQANVGQITNKGLEVLVNFVPVRTKTVEWTSNISYSTNKNRLDKLTSDKYSLASSYFDTGHTGEPIQLATHRVEIGGPIGNFYGFKAVDIDPNGIWIYEGFDKDGKKVNKLATDAVLTDRQVLGNGLPKHYLSWNNTVYVKGFDFNVNMRGAFGFQILNFQRMYYENPNIQYNVLKTAFHKVYGKTQLKDVQRYNSYYIEDGDFWKIDNITVGYTLPIKKNNFIQSVRLYFSGMNMFTFTGYKGIDPEVSMSGLDPGNDSRDKYPTTRTFTFGATIKF